MRRKDDRIVIHFDYDCFYASVFEAENPALRSQPLCVQQKQIIVTCNYEARRRGLHKLQLIRDAKRICPDAIIVLGEDLTKFRDASKALYRFLRGYSWNKKVETLGFDEVFLDVTDIIDYNIRLLNVAELEKSYFHLRPDDPTNGFAFDATTLAGHGYPDKSSATMNKDHHQDNDLRLRLLLGSHFAQHMRYGLEHERGYTATVGISTSKLLAKLVGNVNKPRGQTTLLPPYDVSDCGGIPSSVTSFMDQHDVGRVPGIGFRMSHKLLEFASKHMMLSSNDDTHAAITVGQLRSLPGLTATVLEQILGGVGAQRGIGHKTWWLLHGIDNTPVSDAKDIPTQISIEDSYIRLDRLEDVHAQLLILSKSLLKRMRTDLTTDVGSATDISKTAVQRRWLAYPKTLRLSTRPRPPPAADGTRSRAMNRISRSGPLPQFVFELAEPIEALSERLLKECLLEMFRQLHPQEHGWDLSLLNVAVTNMQEAAGTSKTASGRDISDMFKRQEEVLQPWKITETAFDDDEAHDDGTLRPVTDFMDEEPDEFTHHQQIEDRNKATSLDSNNIPVPSTAALVRHGSEDHPSILSQSTNTDWQDPDDSDDQLAEDMTTCPLCGAAMPHFAIAAHFRFHETND